jgi:hypothetical protein
VHFIGHSAGSALIQAAADALAGAPSPPEVHTTFLDPYLRFDFEGRDWFGRNAAWSDNYFADDLLTGRYTGGQLPHAHSVNLTWLDTENISYVRDYRQCPLIVTEPVPCEEVAASVSSSHGWPYKFYQQTVTGDVPDAQGYGFARSNEGGGWTERAQYPVNNLPVELRGPSRRLTSSPGAQIQLRLDFDGLPKAVSSLGAAFSGNSGFNLSSGLAQP